MGGPTPAEKLNQSLLGIEREILFKERDLEKVNLDLDKFRTLRDKTVETDTSEMASLKRQKDGLAIEIKKMFEVFSDMKEKRIGVEEGLKQFAQEEQSAVSVVAREVLSDISILKKDNESRARKIDSQEKRLSGLSISLSAMKKGLGNKEKALSSGEKTLEKEMGIVLKKENLIIIQAKETKESLLEARRGRVVAHTRLSRANSILKQAEERGSRVTKTLNMKDKALKRHSKVLLGEKRGLDIREKRMKKKEVWLKDKEETLQRSYEEVKAKAKEVGIVI